jgi:hypothetical protein
MREVLGRRIAATDRPKVKIRGSIVELELAPGLDGPLDDFRGRRGRDSNRIQTPSKISNLLIHKDIQPQVLPKLSLEAALINHSCSTASRESV